MDCSNNNSTYYNCDNAAFTLIPIHKIYLGPEMHECITKHGHTKHGQQWSYPYKLSKCLNLLPLNRIELMATAFENNTKLPPVKLCPHYGNYEIIDGRHRIALSIIYGFNHVPALLT